MNADKKLTFYLPLEAEVELKVTVQTRFPSGSASEPRIGTRAPTRHEVGLLQAAMKKIEPGFKWNTTLSSPEA
jgi:hypothetical protein